MNEPCRWWRTNRRHIFTSGRKITNGILDLMMIQIWLGAELSYSVGGEARRLSQHSPQKWRWGHDKERLMGVAIAIAIDPFQHTWVFPKIVGKPPKSSILGGFPWNKPSILGVQYPYFWFNTHMIPFMPRCWALRSSLKVYAYAMKTKDPKVAKQPPRPKSQFFLGSFFPSFYWEVCWF